MKKHVTIVLLCAVGAASVAFAQDPTLAQAHPEASFMEVRTMTPAGPLLRSAQLETWRVATALDSRFDQSQGQTGGRRITRRQKAIIALAFAIGWGVGYGYAYSKFKDGGFNSQEKEAAGAMAFLSGVGTAVIVWGVVTGP